jgi:germination protein M
MKKHLFILIAVSLMIFILCACERDDKKTEGIPVDIYYIDTKTSGLVKEEYDMIGKDTNEQIAELLAKLKGEPKNLVYRSAMAANVTYTFTLNKDKSLTIDFNSAYSQQTGVAEVLCRAVIVKTLTQIKGVDYIQFTVNGSPLVDSNGTFVGTLTADDFIDSMETSTTFRVKLYFANRTGDKLIEYDSDIKYSGTSSIEEMVINQLINGPTELGLYDTIPEGTVLLNISKSEGICTVDFNEMFLEKLPNITEDVAIYSVVNTLVELPDIKKVQFTINSKTVKTYWENTAFDTMYERNLDIIQTPK